jgi:hypothetical protein
LQPKGLPVLTDSTTTPSTENDYLFENDYAYVTKEGEVKLKKNSLFEEKTLATIDTDSLQEQIKAFEKAFENLEAKVDNFFEGAKERLLNDAEAVEENFQKLLQEIPEAKAIGDFESLSDKASEKYEELKKAVAEETQSSSGETEKEAVEVSEEKPQEIKDEDQVETVVSPEESTEESGEAYYRKLLEKAEEIISMSDWAYVSMEFDNIELQWEEGPDPGDTDIGKLKEKIDSLRVDFEEKKREHYEEQKRIRLQNLEKKKELLSQLKAIVDEKKWTHTKEIGKIKGRWDHVKPIPSEEAENLQNQFDALLATFDEHKVDRLVKQKQQEEDNLTGKLVILEKMEGFSDKLEEGSEWQELEKKFEDLTKQFRRIGRVPSEKNQDIWDRYHKAQDTFHSMRFKHDKQYRIDIEKFLSQKKKLIDEAEALIDSDDLADAARKVNKLHRRWKKVGNLPQKDENEMWDRFKEATDAFNDKKSENLELLREQEEENYNEKLKLIEKANELKESEEWEETHKEFQKLMNKWKEIGPVPKRKSGKIWKKFKGAMDLFYDRRRDHFKEVKEERKDNLKEKEEVLEKLAELKSHDDPIKAVELAKPLQDEFKKAGYVPIKHKNRLWKEYREICDVIYDRFRAGKAAADVVGRQNLGQFSKDDIADIRKKQSELNKLRKTTSKLSSELIQMKESLSYFKPSGKGSSLLDDVKKRIEKAEQDLSDKEERLTELEREIDSIKNET